ncbi:MAG: hypothetical protein AAFV90_02295 [Cyanobacteria bacterium J06634_5]
MRLLKVASAFFNSVVDLVVLSRWAGDVSIDDCKPMTASQGSGA